jgi:hypothetical protein
MIIQRHEIGNSPALLAKSHDQWQQENFQDNADFRTNIGEALPP